MDCWHLLFHVATVFFVGFCLMCMCLHCISAFGRVHRPAGLMVLALAQVPPDTCGPALKFAYLGEMWVISLKRVFCKRKTGIPCRRRYDSYAGPKQIGGRIDCASTYVASHIAGQSLEGRAAAAAHGCEGGGPDAGRQGQPRRGIVEVPPRHHREPEQLLPRLRNTHVPS